MNLRLSILLCGLGVCASPAAAAPAADSARLEQALIAMERDSWRAWQQHDVPFWEKFLSDDHVEVHMGLGATGREQVIAGIASQACTVAGYTLDRFTFRRLSKDTALLVYRAAQDTSCGGHKVPSPVWATSLFQKRDGRWENVLYVHTPIPNRPPA
jgi:hypothetical protein